MTTTINNLVFSRSSGFVATYTITGTGLAGGAAFFYLKQSLAQSDDSAETIRKGSTGGLSGVTVAASATIATVAVTVAPGDLPSIATGSNSLPLYYELKYRPVSDNPYTVDQGRITIVRTAIATVPS